MACIAFSDSGIIRRMVTTTTQYLPSHQSNILSVCANNAILLSAHALWKKINDR